MTPNLTVARNLPLLFALACKGSPWDTLLLMTGHVRLEANMGPELVMTPNLTVARNLPLLFALVGKGSPGGTLLLSVRHLRLEASW